MNIHDELELIVVPNDINMYTEEAIERAVAIKKKRKRVRYTIASCLALVCLGTMVLNYSNPVYARNLPLVGSMFAYIQDNMDFAGKYNNYATSVDETTYSNGITIKMSEVYCDGDNLFVSYMIESDKAFSELAKNSYTRSQLGYTASAFIQDAENTYLLNEFGVTGLEGEFIDEYTFVGSEYYPMDEIEMAEQFELQIQINAVSLLALRAEDKDSVVKGIWNFEIPVIVNKDGVQVFGLDAENDEHTIDKVVVSPIMATVYTSYPEELYRGTVDYQVVVFGDKSEKDIAFSGIWRPNNGVTRIPREYFDSELYIYVINNRELDYSLANPYAKEEIDKHAIVKTHIFIAN